MLSNAKREILEHQHYKIVGKHSAVKTCLWCRKALRNEGVCYKSQFYGIKSWRCLQMSPVITACNLRCIWCWRAVEFTENKWIGPVDSPSSIVDGCIEKNKALLAGFGGYALVNRKRLQEAAQPLHFAISLVAEPCIYPKLPELIEEIRDRKMTTFVVTNGTMPEMLKKLVKHQPTQMYVTLPAPNEEIFIKSCRPAVHNGWQKIQRSLSLLHNFERNVVRLTLVKDYNLCNAGEYAKILSKAAPDFIELKAYMHVGLSRQRLKIENMPLHSEVRAFAEKINNHLNYTIAGESKESRVVLLSSGKKKLKIKKGD
ncbi:MAG: 4-demethylwyosine synthase TYW1 [Candidatus ainarchaeum sp.]|nr:4-demethylwyosine synthase TYW1 [Candidatus ainarchaeum sp.]